MKIRSIISFLLILTFASANCYAQTKALSANQVYGLNPLLYNGPFYTFFPAANTKGSQFLDGPEFMKGSVLIRGEKFNNLLLNYDVYNQQVVLKYKTQLSNVKEIVLLKIWLKFFNLGKKHFEILSFSGSKSRIYQVIGKGHYQIFYTWGKNYDLNNSFGATNYAFSKPIRDAYLREGNKLLHYKNNKSFVALFSPKYKPLINKYLRENGIKLNRLKKSKPQVVLNLINYCNTLAGK